jgi:hypothetical protein
MRSGPPEDLFLSREMKRLIIEGNKVIELKPKSLSSGEMFLFRISAVVSHKMYSLDIVNRSLIVVSFLEVFQS